jgi:hypothetical protein
VAIILERITPSRQIDADVSSQEDSIARMVVAKVNGLEIQYSMFETPEVT